MEPEDKFKQELKDLLRKWNVTLEVETDWSVHNTVSYMVAHAYRVYDDNHEVVQDKISLNLGGYFDGE